MGCDSPRGHKSFREDHKSVFFLMLIVACGRKLGALLKQVLTLSEQALIGLAWRVIPNTSLRRWLITCQNYPPIVLVVLLVCLLLNFIHTLYIENSWSRCHRLHKFKGPYCKAPTIPTIAYKHLCWDRLEVFLGDCKHTGLQTQFSVILMTTWKKTHIRTTLTITFFYSFLSCLFLPSPLCCPRRVKGG